VDLFSDLKTVEIHMNLIDEFLDSIEKKKPPKKKRGPKKKMISFGTDPTGLDDVLAKSLRRDVIGPFTAIRVFAHQ